MVHRWQFPTLLYSLIWIRWSDLWLLYIYLPRPVRPFAACANSLWVWNSEIFTFVPICRGDRLHGHSEVECRIVRCCGCLNYHTGTSCEDMTFDISFHLIDDQKATHDTCARIFNKSNFDEVNNRHWLDVKQMPLLMCSTDGMISSLRCGWMLSIKWIAMGQKRTMCNWSM